jgi:hypothetical protein
MWMRLIKLVLAAAFLAAPPSVYGQHLPTEMASAAASGAEDDGEDEGNPRLGLLGLLGLIGLLGLMRPEPNIHIDARRPTRR